MKSVIDQDKAKVKIKIELGVDEWKQALEQAANKVSESLEIKGFRPGKAPLDVVINQAGEARVLSEAADISVGKYYAEAVKEHGLIPLVQPKISVEDLGVDKPLVFSVEIIVMPEVTLGDYKKIKVDKKPIEIDETQVEKTLKDIQRRAAKFTEIDRPSKIGDWMEIDFLGKLDGKPFQGGESKNHPLVLGDKVFLPEFEEALVGLKAGDEKTFSVTFPEGYHQSTLAGKDVEFSVKVHKVKEVILPPIDDDLAKSLGGFETLKDLKADIEKYVTESANKKEKTRQQELAMDKLIELTKVDLPNELIDQELTAMIQDLTHQLSHQKATLDDYLKKNNLTEEKLKEQWQEMAKKRVMAGLALEEFKKQEKIEATDQEVVADIERMKQMYPNQKDEIDKRYGSDLEKKRLKHMLAGQKALEHLWEIATS